MTGFTCEKVPSAQKGLCNMHKKLQNISSNELAFYSASMGVL